MTDLNERLRGIDRLSAPDLWEAAQARAEAGAVTPKVPLARRLAIIAASLLIGVAAVAMVMFAFGSDPTPAPVTPGTMTVENGDIWVKVGGGDGGTAIWRVDPEAVRRGEPMWTDDRGTFAGTPLAPDLVADDYAFSPDGSRVVFSAQVRQGDREVDRELFVMNADGTDPEQLTSAGAYAGFPAWSPDGEQIVYAIYDGNEYIPGCLGFTICPTDLFVINLAERSTFPLARETVSETTPSWSPDGSMIAFAQIDDDTSGSIVTIRSDGSDRRQLSPRGDISFPSWSPDGERILFLRGEGGTNHLWTVAPDGCCPHHVVDTRTDTNVGRPLWSPEGDSIVFARPYGGVGSVWLIDTAGDRPPERLASWPGITGAPIAWQPVPAIPSEDAVAPRTHILVASSGESSDAALLTGTLTIENGCLAVSGGPNTSVYVVWPEGFSIRQGGDDVWLLDHSGSQIARIGDTMRMGGGITNLAHAEPEVVGGIPSTCEVDGPDAYWFAGAPELVEHSPSERDTVGAVRLPGIDAYAVCRVLSLPGDFGDAGDEVVVFEEENTPGYGCVSEGFQHVAVLRDGEVTALSRRITDLVPEAWRVWPYATPDLDGDGQSEIAVATTKPGTARRVWFFTLAEGGGGVEPIYEEGGPFTHMVGAGTDPVGSGESGVYGVYCEGQGGARRIVTWTASAPPGVVVETRWRLSGLRVERLTAPSIPADGQGLPEVGDQSLCESPASPRDEYPRS